MDSELSVIRAPASARLEASVSFLQGEKRQLARANKEETDETEEEEVSELLILKEEKVCKGSLQNI